MARTTHLADCSCKPIPAVFGKNVGEPRRRLLIREGAGASGEPPSATCRLQPRSGISVASSSGAFSLGPTAVPVVQVRRSGMFLFVDTFTIHKTLTLAFARALPP